MRPARRGLLLGVVAATLVACGLKGSTPIPGPAVAVSALDVQGREGRVRLDWEGDPGALAPRRVAGFDVLRREVDPAHRSWFRPLARVTAVGRRRYQVMDLPPTPGRLYVYRVRPQIEGEPTTEELRFAGPEASIRWEQPLPPPEEVAALPLHFAARISWETIPGASGYRVYEVDSGGNPWPEPSSREALVEGSSWTAVALADGVPVHYVVRSVILVQGSAGVSAPPSAPGAEGNAAPAGAEVNASAGEGIAVPAPALPAAATRAATHLLGLGPLPGIESPSSAPVTVTPGITVPPQAPRGLVAVPRDQGIDLSWKESAGEQVVGYVVERRGMDSAGKPAGPWARLNPELVTARSYLDSDVVEGMSYEYRVRAQDAAGTPGDASQAKRVSFRTRPEPPLRP